MIAGDGIPTTSAERVQLAASPRLASLPRSTANALEQLADTMLAALHSGAGAIWVEHEHRVYTLILRQVNVEIMHSLQQAITHCGQPLPATVQVLGRTYAVACAGYPLLQVFTAVQVEEARPVHRRLLPRFAKLALALLQTNSTPIGLPAEDPSKQAYRVVVESSLRRLAELMGARGCALLWFSSWNNSWHRFTVGNVPSWLYQQMWDMPSPGEGMEVWMQAVQASVQKRGYHCVADGMVVRDVLKGCVFLWRDQSGQEFSADDIEWLRITVGMIASSLDVLETQTELLQRVYQDPLTGVFNRLYFEIAYRQVLSNAQRHPRPVSLLLMDVDEFKRINDTCGHEVGDLVLQVVGQVLQQVRSGDVPARFGGDEFVVLLPDTDKNGARLVAQRLQNSIQQATEQLGLPFPLRLTIGVATVTDGDPSLLLLADQDMYEKKRLNKAAVS